MAFLTLNGVDIPAAVGGTAERNPLNIGEFMRAIDGSPRDSFRRRLEEWRYAITPQALADAEAYRGLINGDGHKWTFDSNTISSRGLAPSSTGGTLIHQATGGFGDTPKYPNLLRIDGYSGFLEFSLGTSPVLSEWTMMLWGIHPDYSSPTWKHLIIRSDAAKWRQGVRADSTYTRPFGFTPSTGILRLETPEYGGANWAAGATVSLGARTTVSGHVHEVTTPGTTGGSPPTWNTNYLGTTTDNGVAWTNIGAGALRVSELVFLPYKIPDSWGPLLFAAHNAATWSALPRISASGDFHTRAVTVRGQAERGVPVPAAYSSGFSVGQSFDFVLREVA